MVKEMADALALDLVDKALVTDQIVLTVGYDTSSITAKYKGEIQTDRYGRKIPKHAHGTANLEKYTSSGNMIMNTSLDLFDRVINKELLIRRVYITATHVIPEKEAKEGKAYEQLSLFTDFEKEEMEKQKLEKERKMQEAMLSIKKRFGKNAVLKGMNLEEGATAKERNNQIGGIKLKGKGGFVYG